ARQRRHLARRSARVRARPLHRRRDAFRRPRLRRRPHAGDDGSRRLRAAAAGAPRRRPLLAGHDAVRAFLGPGGLRRLAALGRAGGRGATPAGGLGGGRGAALAARREHLDDYLQHAFTLAEAGPGSTAAARAFLEQAYTPVANATWPQTVDSGFGDTNVAAPV